MARSGRRRIPPRAPSTCAAPPWWSGSHGCAHDDGAAELARRCDPERATTRHASPPARPRRRLVRVALIALLLLAAATAWIAYSGLRAKGNLLRAAGDVKVLQTQAESGNVAGERVTLKSLQREAHAARVETAGPIWRLARLTPVVGSNAAAITRVASAVDDLAQQALPSLVDTSATLDLRAIAPHDGRINLAPIQHAGPAILAVASAVQRVRDQVAEHLDVRPRACRSYLSSAAAVRTRRGRDHNLVGGARSNAAAPDARRLPAADVRPAVPEQRRVARDRWDRGFVGDRARRPRRCPDREAGIRGRRQQPSLRSAGAARCCGALHESTRHVLPGRRYGAVVPDRRRPCKRDVRAGLRDCGGRRHLDRPRGAGQAAEGDWAGAAAGWRIADCKQRGVVAAVEGVSGHRGSSTGGRLLRTGRQRGLRRVVGWARRRACDGRSFGGRRRCRPPHRVESPSR